MSRSPRLVLQSDPSRIAPLDPAIPLTIGRAAYNRLSLPREERLSDHHAVVRFSVQQGWLICDWNSDAGTFLAGIRSHQCRPLPDGSAIQRGSGGPVLLFQASVATSDTSVAAPAIPAAAPAADTGPGTAPRPAGSGRGSAPLAPTPPTSIDFAGERLPLDQILSATVRSEPRHPNIFSWWLLLCLGSLMLLPFPPLFWLLELTGLAGWIVLGSRKEHSLVVVLRNGLAYRRTFANRPTALSHRNGIRKALGQTLDG
ncbi:MAG: FHA domain-containing protein [Cyanobacteriota bacterium]